MYPSSSSTNPNSNGEHDEIQQQINQKTNESLESTRRMLGLTSECERIGVETMVNLDEQGEKLAKIEQGLDTIHVEMNKAEDNLNELQKCCGLCVMPWNRVRRTRMPFDNSSVTMSSDTSSPITSEPKSRIAADGMPSNGFITRITNDDREQEMDDNLQLVASHLGNLKNMALDMGDTIEYQNKQLDRINNKAEAGTFRVDQANKQTKDILRKA